MMESSHQIDLGRGIVAVDTGFSRAEFDAAYLVVQDGRAAFIDTGHNAAVPRLLAALESRGLGVDAVDWVIPTHVHLDHAGGVGSLMAALPRARLLVHPRGAPHMIDPGALVAGAQAVYGADEVARTYGRILPVPEERVTSSEDGMVIELGSRRLELIHTPGHARHHHCIWDERTRGWFTGDTFGISYREFDSARGAFIFPSSTPVQFEPGPMRQSVRRMLEREPECAYLTHFARVTGLPALGAMLLEQIDEMESLALAAAASADPTATLRAAVGSALAARAAAHSGMTEERARELLAIDIELNAQGLGVWLQRQQTARA